MIFGYLVVFLLKLIVYLVTIVLKSVVYIIFFVILLFTPRRSNVNKEIKSVYRLNKKVFFNMCPYFDKKEIFYPAHIYLFNPEIKI